MKSDKKSILVLENCCLQNELETFLKQSQFDITLVSWRPPTPEAIRAVQLRYRTRVKEIRMNDIIPKVFFDVGIFPSQYYEPAQTYAANHPDTIIFIIHDHSFDFEFEETSNLRIRAWQTISEYCKSLLGKKPNGKTKPKSKDANSSASSKHSEEPQPDNEESSL